MGNGSNKTTLINIILGLLEQKEVNLLGNKNIKHIDDGKLPIEPCSTKYLFKDDTILKWHIVYGNLSTKKFGN